MIRIYDLDECEHSLKNGSYGGRCKKEGIIWNGQNMLVKYTLRSEERIISLPLAEYIGSHVYSILGADVQDTFLAVRNGRLVAACTDIVPENGMLLELRAVFNAYNGGMEASDDINAILSQLESSSVLKNIVGIKERFFMQLLTDAFIGNAHRSLHRWGLIRNIHRKDTCAPVFSNGHSFDFSDRMFTAYKCDDKPLTMAELIKLLISDVCFVSVYERLVPLMEEKMSVIEEMINDIPEKAALSDGSEMIVMSDIQKAYCIDGMRSMMNNFSLLLRTHLTIQ